MFDQCYRDLASSAEAAVRQPEFVTVQRRASKLRRRRWAATGTAALVLAVLGASAASALTDVGSSGAQTAGMPYTRGGDEVRWADGADANHLFAVVSECLECEHQLVASADGGRTWQRRGEPLPGGGRPMIAVVSDRILILSPMRSLAAVRAGDPADHGKVSTDGGRTWKAITVISNPVAAVPSGSRAIDCRWVTRALSQQCRIYAVDPATGNVAPLAVQPPLNYIDLTTAPISGGTWAQGVDPASGKPAMAVSHDGGRSWSTTVFSDEPIELPQDRGELGPMVARMYLPYSTTTNGTLAYAAFVRAGNVTRIYRSDDGGLSWRRTDDGYAMPAPLAGPASTVTTDGTHMFSSIDGSGFRFVASRDGKAYSPVQLPGIVANSGVPQPTGPASYCYVSDGDLYVSGDGLTWQRVLS